MELSIIKEAEDLVSRNSKKLTDKEKAFMFQFAIETEDSELTQNLVMELIEEDKDNETIIEKYRAICDPRPNWLLEVISTLVELEMLRIRQEQAILVLREVLHAREIEDNEELMEEKLVEEEKHVQEEMQREKKEIIF